MQRRPVVAAALAVVPALGHAYLRRWSRGAAWLALLAGSALVFAGLFGVSGSGALASVEFVGWSLSTGLRIVVPLVVVLALSSLDAYVLARRDAMRAVVTCPRCRREVDLSLGFCWYCSVEFDYVRSEP
ncbi:DUF7575 domain-containing protein [Halobaculum lipolyticum]|uniref:Zinc ribbon domain-containing protein n=1 Tax=Halobaculum lipolyticum TaxID=3032001 RepID=A0ABD5W3W4_9EURY|nr:zinc ribbon domain-containing protein [Halobaculum sp. DT31]